MKLKVLLILSLIFSFYCAKASKTDTIFIENDFEYLELGKSLDYTSSNEGQINIDNLIEGEVYFKKNDANLLILDEDEYLEDLWIRIVIKNKSNTDRRLFLYLDNALINYVEYYEYDGKKQISHQLTGDAFPISERVIKYRNPIYNIKVSYNQTKTIF